MKKSFFRNLENMGIVLPDIQFQGYDKGINLKGNNRGMQIRVHDFNPQTFFATCTFSFTKLRGQ